MNPRTKVVKAVKAWACYDTNINEILFCNPCSRTGDVGLCIHHKKYDEFKPFKWVRVEIRPVRPISKKGVREK